MGFKNMKRDDHGHVISNDETDGQKCQHQSGGNNRQDSSERENLRKEVEYKLKKEGNTSDVRLMAERRGFKIEDGKVVEDLKSQAMADRATGGSGEAFDDDYDEEFDEYDNEMKKAQEENAKKSLDLQDAINLADDDILDDEFGKNTPERKLAGAMKQPLSERKYIRYPNGQIRYKDEIYPDEGSLEDVAGPDALKEIVDANEEENDERNFENEIEKRFHGWRPHWTNRKKNGGAHFEHDAFLNSFDYNDKVYKNTDERIKWNRDMAEYYRKNGMEKTAKEHEDNANFIEKNKDRFNKYSDIANKTRGKRWLQLQGENARIYDLKRGLKDGKYTVEDLMKYLKGE